jgi:hypothetical protein
MIVRNSNTLKKPQLNSKGFQDYEIILFEFQPLKSKLQCKNNYSLVSFN